MAICLHHQKPNNRLDKVGEILLLSRHCPCRFFDLRLQLLTSLHHQLSFFLYILNHFLNLRARISQETATSRHECYLRKVTHTFHPKFIADGPHALTLEGRASAVRDRHSPGTKPVHHRLHRLRFRADLGGEGTISKCPCATTHFLPYCPPTEASREAAGFVHHRARLADSELIPRYERLMARSTRVLIG